MNRKGKRELNKNFSEMSTEKLEKELKRIEINIAFAIRRGDKIAQKNLEVKKETVESLLEGRK